MKKILLTLFAALAFCGSISAQYDSHWDEFNYLNYQFNLPLVAFIQIDGEYVSEQDYEALEIAYFVGDECRGHDFLADYTEDGDPYPILEGAIYYTDPGEEVTFKLYNHETGTFYEECVVNNYIIKTGEEHVELYFDYGNAVVLNFTSPGPPEPSGSYWPEFVDFNYDDQGALVAGIIIDGHIITLDDEN